MKALAKQSIIRAKQCFSERGDTWAPDGQVGSLTFPAVREIHVVKATLQNFGFGLFVQPFSAYVYILWTNATMPLHCLSVSDANLFGFVTEKR